ncbi:MAG: RDD family protein [Chloroflexi bacterium]|nr:MAG: RDD family protein [Chloroflexota bacterium]
MPSIDEILNIDTPENVIFGYEVVGIGSRFIAALVDTLIIGIIQGILYLLMGLIISFDFDFMGDNSTVIIAALTLMNFLFLWGYYIFFEMQWNGRTPGKQLAGLRVIRQDGTPITLPESIIRNLVRLVDFLPVGYGVGIVTMFIDSNARRLGDMAAGTIVIREQEEVTLDTVKKSAQPQQLRASGEAEATARTWPVHLLSETDIQLAESFLTRQSDLKNRNEVAYQIGKRLMKKMGLPTSEAIFARDMTYKLSTIVKEWHKLH